MENLSTSLIYLAGTVFVVMFAVRFFNNKSNDKSYEPRDDDVKDALSRDPKLEPVLPKHLTEKSRYNIYQGAFVLCTVVLYYIMSLIFPTLISIIFNMNIEDNYHVALVLGTLAFISLSPNIPYIKEILNGWRDDLHVRADIPDSAMNIFNILRYNEINKSSVEFKENCYKILVEKVDGHARCDIDQSYFTYRKKRIERKWSRLVYLMHAIDQWGNSQQFKRHLKSESLKWLALRAYYRDNLIPKMERYREGGLDEGEIEETKNEIDAISIKIYWLITLLLFMANKAAEDPCIHLNKIGWIVTLEQYFNFSSRQIFFTGSVIFVSILLGAGIGTVILIKIAEIGSSDYIISPTDIFYWLIYGIPMYVVPLVVTLFLKRYMSINDIWPVKRPEYPQVSFPMRPWNIYFFAGLFSYLATVAILLGIMVFISFFKPIDTPQPISQIVVYSGLAFITSAFICYLIDTPSPGWETSWRYYIKSLFPSLLQGGCNVAMIVYAFLLFTDEQKFDLSLLDKDEKGKLIIYSVIGFIIGIAMFLTSRIGTKYYERRESDEERSSDGWWTIYIDSAKKRVRAMNSVGNHLDIIVDDELKQLAHVGDTIEFHNEYGLAMTGSVDEIDGETIRIVIPV